MNLSKILILVLLALSDCIPSNEQTFEGELPAGYSYERMEKVKLSMRMEEVSGLEWVGENELWAIEDESSSIFKLDIESGKVTKDSKFAKNKDIEDLMVIDGVAWVLESNGKLYEVKNPFEENQETEDYSFPIKEKRDFESLFYDPNENDIWILCKDCSWDEGPKKTSAIPFSLDRKEFQTNRSKELKRKQLRALPSGDEEKKYQMKPSAAAKHPFRDEIYVVSSAGHWLLIMDLDWNLKDVYHLDKDLFKQPEGITFDPKGNLYFSNEARGGTPNLLIFDFSQ
mgnify:CR=1 FL=1